MGPMDREDEDRDLPGLENTALPGGFNDLTMGTRVAMHRVVVVV